MGAKRSSQSRKHDDASPRASDSARVSRSESGVESSVGLGEAVAASVATAPAGPPAILAENLVKVFGDRRAVDGVSFSVPRGEIVGFLGPNGAGKTTTMRILAGYHPATSGRARIDGHDVERESLAARARVGYLPEQAPLHLDMSVRDCLEFMAAIKGVPRGAVRGAVDRAIDECGLGEARSRVVGNLSRGFRQRVGLAQALVGDPAVVILDEPTSGLDPAQIAEIRALIRGMAGRRTVLLSTHILPEVSMTCGRVLVIHRGRLVAEGTPDRLVPRGIQNADGTSAHPAAEGRVVAIRVALDEAAPGELPLSAEADSAERARALVAGIAGVSRCDLEPAGGRGRASLRARLRADAVGPAADPRAAIARELVQAGFGVLELGWAGESLEQVFLRIVSDAPTAESGRRAA